MSIRSLLGLETRPGAVEGDISSKELLTVLGNERRQEVVRHLVRDVEPDEVVKIADLADYIVQVENGPGYSSSERKAVYVALYQSHLPKLEDVGAIEATRSRNEGQDGPNEFRPGPNAEALFDLLRKADAIAGERGVSA